MNDDDGTFHVASTTLHQMLNVKLVAEADALTSRPICSVLPMPLVFDTAFEYEPEFKNLESNKISNQFRPIKRTEHAFLSMKMH